MDVLDLHFYTVLNSEIVFMYLLILFMSIYVYLFIYLYADFHMMYSVSWMTQSNIHNVKNSISVKKYCAAVVK